VGINNLRMAKLWFIGAFYPLLLLAVVFFADMEVDFIHLVAFSIPTVFACIGAASLAYSNYLDESILEMKLKKLEDEGVMFRAGYCGIGETFTAVFPDGTFVDYGGWMPTGENDETVQWFAPTEFGRVADETLESLHHYKTNYGEEGTD